MQIELTQDERHGLIEAVDRGLDDRQDYMQNGNPHIDYGDEWPEAAREQSRRWKNCASAIRKLGNTSGPFERPNVGEFHTMAQACDNLAASLEASAKEYGLAGQVVDAEFAEVDEVSNG